MDQNSKEKKLFFFGKPGCLKVKFDIPIRPSENSDLPSNENEGGEKCNMEANSKSTLIDDKNTTKKPENSSDDDGEELLKKIDAALEVKNEHQSEDISKNQSNETIEEIQVNDNSNNHVDEISPKTIENESKNIEIQNDETSTNEESQSKCEEKSALEKASPANTETITEKIENVYNVKSVENNIEINDENNLAVDECNPIEFKSEEISSKSVDLVDKKLEETESVVENDVASQIVENNSEPNENIEKVEDIAPNEISSEEKNFEKEEISSKQVDNLEVESISVTSMDEKSSTVNDEKVVASLEENKEKEIQSEILDSELPENKNEICESSIKNEAIESVICRSDQSDSISDSHKSLPSEQRISSSIIIEESTEIVHSDVVDNANITKFPDLQENVSSENLKSEIKITESISKISEEQTVCEDELIAPDEESKNSVVSRDENTCPSQEPEVFNETSINIIEESVPKIDNLEQKDDSLEPKQNILKNDEGEKLNSQQAKEIVAEKVESQIQENELSDKDIDRNMSKETLETTAETEKYESLNEAENVIAQSEKNDIQKHQNEEIYSAEIEIKQSTEISTQEISDTTKDKNIISDEGVNPCPEATKNSHDNHPSTSEAYAKNDKKDEELVSVVPTENLSDNQSLSPEEDKNNQVIINSDQIVPDQECQQETESNSENTTSKEELSSTNEDDIEKSKTVESKNEEVKITEQSMAVEKLEESQNTEIQVIQTDDQNLIHLQENSVELTNSEEDTKKVDLQDSVSDNQNKESLTEITEQPLIEESRSEQHDDISTNVIVPQLKTDKNVEACIEHEQNTSSLMESEECEEKEEILENIQDQNSNVHDDDSLIIETKEIISMQESNIQESEAMEIEDSEETKTNLHADLKPEMNVQDDSTSKEEQEIEACDSGHKEATKIKDHIIDEQCEVSTENIPANIINVQAEVEKEEKILQIEQIELKSEISIQEENYSKEDPIDVQLSTDTFMTSNIQEVEETKVQCEEVQQNVDILQSAEEKSMAEISNNVDKKIPQISNEEDENISSSDQNNDLEDTNAEISQSSNLEKEKKHEIPLIDTGNAEDEFDTINKEATISANEDLPVENKSVSKESIMKPNEIVETPTNDDRSDLNEDIEIVPEKMEEEVLQCESHSVQKQPDIELTKEIKENIKSQSIQNNLEEVNEPKEFLLTPPNEELNEIKCSASVEIKETSQAVSDKPEVLTDISKKESFENENETEKHSFEVQSSESKNIEEFSQNIKNVEISSPSIEFTEFHTQKIDVSDENEPNFIEDLSKNQESKNENKCIDDSLSSSDPINNENNFKDEVEVIPQKPITVEENLNEKINDNQVELSKNDNKSSSLEKVSPVEDITIQNEFSKDLNKNNKPLIKEDKNIDEGSSIAQLSEGIQTQLDVKIDENLKDQNIEEKKVNLETEKQYESITEHRTEDNLTDINNDEKCKDGISIEPIKEVVIENLTEKINLNEMPVKEICTDNNQDNIKMQDDPKNLMESDSKCSKTVIPPTEKIAINLEIESKLPHKETKEILNDKPCIEDSVSKEILNMQVLKDSSEKVDSLDQKEIVENVFVKHVELTSEISSKNVEEHTESQPVDPLEEVNFEAQTSNVFDNLLDKETKLESIPVTKSFQKPVSTRKRKMSERKSISESDSDGGSHFVTDSVSNEKSSDEETVATKKPRIRNKITATRNTRATRQSARVSEETKLSPEIKPKDQKKPATEEKKDEEKTLQNFKFDYDENEDIASKMAAIKNLICKETPKKPDDDDSNESSDDESSKKKPMRKGRKGKRGRTGKKNDAQESSSDDSKSAKLPESKRSKTSESEETNVEKQSRKKRESAGKGLLKYIDTSLVIETVETEAPIRQSRRIAQQKIREETERRQMEEKMLKQMKAEAEKKKKMALIPEPPDDENDRSSDESYKDSTKKKKTKIKPSDKQWQTSSSHSENSESEDEFERPPSDPGSPLFRSDHEFSPESDDDEAPVQPIKRARTAKKQVEESSDDEDVNPNHACQVCHKTDSPEWILLCDECDHGYHCSCLKPIIFCIPSGNWYCPLCCHKKLVDDLSLQLEKLDTLIVNIKAEEMRKQKQLEIKKLTEITQENILKDKRKNRSENSAKKEDQSKSTRDKSSNDESESSDDDSSENSSDNEPLNEMFYKLRRRNQATTSYRFNDYDDLINSAIKRDMDEVKGMGNAGRGKDISTIIEADKEEKKLQKMEKEKDNDDENEKPSENQEGEESSGSEIVRPKKAIQRKKKNRKLNNLDATSEEDQASDEDFKGTPSSNSDTEEEYSVSSNDVSESSLDLPLKKGKAGSRRTRSAAKNRRYDENFIDDNSSDDEPLIKKRIKKQADSDEEEFDINEENSDGSTPEDIDSEDLCDDTESDDSSENNWPKKKKKRNASYDIKKPKRNVKKPEGGKDKAFRAGISKKKILKQSDNESEASDNESDKGRRRTRGKKLLYLIEDDYESDDGIKPGIGVVRPETPPEERELFVKKQEEIKRMLAEKNTEAARQLAVPTIEPIKFALEKPESPEPPPLTSDELASLSTIPKNVIEGAKALDMDYNKIKPIHFGALHVKSSDHPSAHDMSEEDLARMMEEEDFAQHQLKMVGETINRNKLLELEVKEEAFANIGKGAKIKDEKIPEKLATPETKKRARKPKQEKQPDELSSPPAKIMQTEGALQKGPATQHIAQSNVSISVPTSLPHAHEPSKPQTQNIPSVPPLISNPVSHPLYPSMPPRYPGPHHLNVQDRPSVLSNYIPRHEVMPPRLEGMRPRLESMPPRLGMQPRLEGMLSRLEMMGPRMQGMGPPRLEGMGPRLEGITSRLEGMAARLEVGSPQHHLRFPHQPQEGFSLKSPPIAPQSAPQPPNEEVEEKKKGRRKKYTPLRTDLVDSNASKVAKLETPTTSSVIHSTLNLSTERPDDKSKVSLPPLQRAKPEVFNPATSSSSSVITRLLQPQQRPQFGGFAEQMNVSVTSPSNPNATNPRAFPEDMKHLPIAKQVRPPGQFPENPFVPRGMHTIYRGPPTTQPSIYGLPSHHARIPYPFHLHPNNNLRPNMQEYGAPYNIPPQFGYYAPPAHSRQHPPNPAAPPLSHQEHPDIPPNNARPNNNVNPNDEPSESSEFGGLVSYFSSQQELD